MVSVYSTWMVPAKACRGDKKTVRETLKGTGPEALSNLEHFRLILLGLSVLVRRWKDTVADGGGLLC